MELEVVSGHDYPNTYREFIEMFPDGAACAAYLVQLRWPEGFICPACKTSSKLWSKAVVVWSVLSVITKRP